MDMEFFKMEKKSFINSANISRISIAADIVIPIALYNAMINHSDVIAWALFGIIVMTRLALVITTK
jgi:hypothetical protein